MQNELPFYHRLYVILPLLAGIMTLGILWDYYAVSNKTQAKTVQVSAKKQSEPKVKLVKIQDSRCSSRSTRRNCRACKSSESYSHWFRAMKGLEQ